MNYSELNLIKWKLIELIQFDGIEWTFNPLSDEEAWHVDRRRRIRIAVVDPRRSVKSGRFRVEDAVPVELRAVALHLVGLRVRRLAVRQRQRRPVDQNPVRISIRNQRQVDQSIQFQAAADDGAADGFHAFHHSASGWQRDG